MKKIVFYDTETTGLPDWKKPSGGESQPHIVQLAAICVDADTREIVGKLDCIIKPDGWEIPQETSKIHGITTERALDEGIPEREAVGRFLSLWRGCHRVAHNRTFDQRIIRIALKRYFDKEEQDLWAEKDNHDCTMLMAKPIMQMPPKTKNRYGFKPPKLEEAFTFFTGDSMKNAHQAMADTEACMAVYWAIKAGVVTS